jgi:hypothetical protein
MGYGTTAGLKLRISAAASADDTVLGEMLLSASALVDELSGHSWPTGSVTGKFYAIDAPLSEDWRTLFLRGCITTLTTLTNGDGVVISLGNTILWPDRDVNKGAIILTQASGYTFNFGASEDAAIQVAGTWAVPYFVTEAAYLLAEALYRRGEENAITLKQAKVDALAMLGQPFAIGAIGAV